MSFNHQGRMLDLDEHLEKRRVEAERRHHEDAAHTRRILEDAHSRADEIIAEAKVTVGQVRADSEREISALTEKRESINAQLTNVREMLAALTSGTPALDPLAMPELVEAANVDEAESESSEDVSPTSED